MRQRCFLTLFTAAVAAAEPGLIRQIDVSQVEFAGLSPDRIQFALRPRMVMSQSASIREIHFSETYLGSIPVYVPPILENIEVRASETIERRLVVTIYFRDLQSLEELRRIIEDGRAVAKGKAVAEVGLNFLQSLVLWSRSALAPVTFSQEIPVAFPGGAFTRLGALGLLRTAEAAASVVDAGREHLGLTPANPYADSVLQAVARFQVEDKTGARQTIEVRGNALRTGDRGLITVRELAVPWEYDADLTMAIATGRVKVVKDSFDLSAGPLSSRQGEIRMVRQAKPAVEYTKMRHPAAGNKAIRVAPRASGSNLVYWELQTARPSMLKFDVTSSTWDRVAVFRGTELIYLRARRDGNRIVLDDPIDSRAKGSPLIAAGGVIGILQDERSALPASSVLEMLELSAK